MVISNKNTISRISRNPYDGVVLTVPVSIPYVRFSHQSAHWWIARALREIVIQSKLNLNEVDGFSVASFSLFPDNAVGLTQHFGLSPRWLDQIPTGGASGVVALRRAARAVQSGDVDYVACIAGDANQIDSFQDTVASFSRFAQDATYPYGAGGPNACFALLTDYYMREFGITREDFGRLCMMQRENGMRNPHALMKVPLTMEAYLNARPISEPLHLYDCVMPVAGAEGFLVMRQEEAERRNLPYANILATIERHNAFPEDPVQIRGGWALDIDEFYDMAKLEARQVDILQTYDDYPVISMMQMEDLGFCDKGQAAEFIRQNDLTINGDLPHNTSGGQLSAGQAGAAGGFLGLVEALRQITGTAGKAQVRKADNALVSGFGMINYDRGLCSAAALLQGKRV